MLQTDESDTGSWIVLNKKPSSEATAIFLFVCFLSFWNLFLHGCGSSRRKSQFSKEILLCGETDKLKGKRKNDLWLSSPSPSALLVGRSARKKKNTSTWWKVCATLTQGLPEKSFLSYREEISNSLWAVYRSVDIRLHADLRLLSSFFFLSRQMWINNPSLCIFVWVYSARPFTVRNSVMIVLKHIVMSGLTCFYKYYFQTIQQVWAFQPHVTGFWGHKNWNCFI